MRGGDKIATPGEIVIYKFDGKFWWGVCVSVINPETRHIRVYVPENEEEETRTLGVDVWQLTPAETITYASEIQKIKNSAWYQNNFENQVGGNPVARVGLHVKFKRDSDREPWTYGIIETLSTADNSGLGERRDLIRTGHNSLVRIKQAIFYNRTQEFGLGWVPLTDEEEIEKKSFYDDLQASTGGKRRTKRRKYNNELRARQSNKKKGRRSRK